MWAGDCRAENGKLSRPCCHDQSRSQTRRESPLVIYHRHGDGNQLILVLLETIQAGAPGQMTLRPAGRPFGVRKLASALIGPESGSNLPHSSIVQRRASVAVRSGPSDAELIGACQNPLAHPTRPSNPNITADTLRVAGQAGLRERSDALEIFGRSELCPDGVVGERDDRLVIKGTETTRSVEDGIPTRSVGTRERVATVASAV